MDRLPPDQTKEWSESQKAALLFSKLAEATAGIGALAKGDRNTFSNYQFTGYEELYAHLRPMMLKYGFFIIPNIIDHHETPFQTKDGKTTIRTILTMRMDIVDIDTGYIYEAFWAGADQDTGGKSMGQAATEGDKRFCFKLLKISSKDDVDPDTKTTGITGAQPEQTGSLRDENESQKSEKLTNRQMIDLYDGYRKWLVDVGLPKERSGDQNAIMSTLVKQEGNVEKSADILQKDLPRLKNVKMKPKLLRIAGAYLTSLGQTEDMHPDIVAAMKDA